jgi:hypothetical protein
MNAAEIDLLREEIEIVIKSREAVRKERDELIIAFDEIWSAMEDYFPEATCYVDCFKSIEALQFNANQNAGGNK